MITAGAHVTITNVAATDITVFATVEGAHDIGRVGIQFGAHHVFLSRDAATVLAQGLLPHVDTVDIDNTPTGEVGADLTGWSAQMADRAQEMRDDPEGYAERVQGGVL